MGRQRVSFLFMYPDKEKKEPLPAASLTIKWGGIGIILIRNFHDQYPKCLWHNL